MFNCSATWSKICQDYFYLSVCLKTEAHFHRTVASPSKQTPPTVVKGQTCDFLFAMRTRHVQVLPSGFYVPDVNGRIISSSYNLASNMSSKQILIVKNLSNLEKILKGHSFRGLQNSKTNFRRFCKTKKIFDSTCLK